MMQKENPEAANSRASIENLSSTTDHDNTGCAPSLEGLDVLTSYAPQGVQTLPAPSKDQSLSIFETVETRDGVLRRATKEGLDKLSDSSLPPIDMGAQFLLSFINSEITEVNQKANKAKSKPFLLCKMLPVRSAAELLLKYRQIVLIPSDTGDSNDAMLCVFDEQEGIWCECSGDNHTITKLLREVSYSAESHWMDEVILVLRDLSPERRVESSPNLIPLNDCIYDMSTGSRIDYSADYVFLAKVRTNLPEQEPQLPIIDGWDPQSWLVETMGSQALAEAILEVIAWCLRPRHFADKMVWFHGEKGSNGKGTIMELLRCILGGRTGKGCVSIPLGDFDSQFGLTGLIGAVANLSDESDVGGYLKSASRLKSITSHDPVTIDRKNRNPVSVKLHVPMVFCINDEPKLKDKSESLLRRLHIIPFNNRFMDGDRNTNIKHDYLRREEVREWFVWNALVGLGNFSELSVPEEVGEALKNYRNSNDSVAEFWEEWGDRINESTLSLLPAPMLYAAYQSWMRTSRKSTAVETERNFSNRFTALAVGSGQWIEERTPKKEKKKYSITDWYCTSAHSLAFMHSLGKSERVNDSEVVTGDLEFAAWTRTHINLNNRKTRDLNTRVRGLVRDLNAVAPLLISPPPTTPTVATANPQIEAMLRAYNSSEKRQ